MIAQAAGKRARDQECYANFDGSTGGAKSSTVLPIHKQHVSCLPGPPVALHLLIVVCSEQADAVRLTNFELRVSHVSAPYRGVDGASGLPIMRNLLFERVLLTPLDDQCAYAYDLDIGLLVRCRRIVFDVPRNTYQAVSGMAESPMLIIRKAFLLRQQLAKPDLDSHAATLAVSGVLYHTRDCYDVATMQVLKEVCVGFPAGSDLAVAPDAALQLRKHTLLAADGGAISEITLQHPAMVTGLAVPGQTLDLNRRGERFKSQVYGEVYRGRRLVREDIPSGAGTAGPVYHMFHRATTVVVKAVRYPNTHLPNAATDFRLVNGAPAVLVDLIHHEGVQQGRPLTSRDVLGAGHFARLRYAENPMTELEIARYAADEARRVVDSFRQQPPDLRSTLPDPSHLLRRFLPVTDAGIACDSLFLVSPFSQYGSLDRYMGRAPGLNNPLSERCAKHVVRHLLQALALLHDRGVAHLDISLGNILLRAAKPAAAALKGLAGCRLSDEQFELLDILLFDFGQAVAHPGIGAGAGVVPVGNAAEGLRAFSADSESGLAASQLSDGTDPGITLEAARTDSEGSSPRSPMPRLQQGRTISTSPALPTCSKCSNHNSCDAAGCPVHSFGLLPPPARPIAKATYRPPEVEFGSTQKSGNAPDEPFCGMCVDMWQLGVLGLHLFTGIEYLDRIPGTTFRRSLYDFAKFRFQQAQEADPLTALSSSIGVLQVPQFSPNISDDAQWVFLSTLPISAEAMDFLSRLLVYDPARRMSAEQALQHPWFQG